MLISIQELKAEFKPQPELNFYLNDEDLQAQADTIIVPGKPFIGEVCHCAKKKLCRSLYDGMCNECLDDLLYERSV